MSIYVTLGIFLLLSVRDPTANRSLIAFGVSANLAHAAVLAAIVGVVLVGWLRQSSKSQCEHNHSREFSAFDHIPVFP